MKKILANILTISAVLAMAFTALSPLAASATTPSFVPTTGQINTDNLGLTYGGQIGLGTQDIRQTIANIIRVAMGLLGIVAVVIILVGGFKWMTAGGNEEQVGEAKKWIFSGVIGLAIILSAYALATFVIQSLVSATTDQVV